MNLIHRLAPPPPALRSLPISEDGFLIDLPGRLRTSQEKDNTLTALLPGKNFAALRVSVLMLSLKLNPAALDLGLQHLRLLAKKTSAELLERDGRAYASYQDEVKGPPPARMHYHFAACRNAVLVASIWVQQGKDQEPETQELLAASQAALRSFRPNPLYEADQLSKTVPRELSPWEVAFLEVRRGMVNRLLQERLKLPGLLPGEDGLPALQLLLERKIVRKDDNTTLEALGVVFGDILARKAGLAWAVESEPRGDIPVLTLPGSRVSVYATTLIWRRIERNEKVELRKLLDGIIESIQSR